MHFIRGEMNRRNWNRIPVGHLHKVYWIERRIHEWSYHSLPLGYDFLLVHDLKEKRYN